MAVAVSDPETMGNRSRSGGFVSFRLGMGPDSARDFLWGRQLPDKRSEKRIDVRRRVPESAVGALVFSDPFVLGLLFQEDFPSAVGRVRVTFSSLFKPATNLLFIGRDTLDDPEPSF